MKDFKMFLDWYKKTIDQEMKANYTNLNYIDRALCDLLKLHQKDIYDHFNYLIEEYEGDHNSIGELFHKGFRQGDIVLGYDGIIWDLLCGVNIFWDVLSRFNRGDEKWDDYIWNDD